MPADGRPRAGDRGRLGARRTARALREAVALSWRAGAAATVGVWALSAVSGFTPGLSAWFVRLLIDELSRPAPSARRAALLVLAGAGATLVMVVGAQVGQLVNATLRRSITVGVQDRLYRHVNSWVGLRYFEDPAMQDRLRLAEQGAAAAPLSASMLMSEVFRGTVTILGFVGALLVLWPPMALLVAVAAVPALVAQRALALRNARTAEVNVATTRRQVMFQQLLTDPGTAKEVRLYGLGDLLRERLRGAVRETSGRELAVARRGAVVQTAVGLLAATVTAMGGLVAVREVIAGRLTLGGLTLFTAAVIGVQSALGGLLAQVADAVCWLAQMNHYVELLAMPPDLIDGTGQAPPLREAIRLRDVWFRYDPDGPWVLRGVTLTLPAGSTIGLVGRNGAGKSTLVKLLCRLYDPERGTIEWDGVDIRRFRADTLRGRLGATFQDFSRYEMTAADNIGVGEVTRMRDRHWVRRAAELAGVGATVAALPDGYDTMLSRVFFDEEEHRGVYLSGGQWQRLALARTFMREDPDLVILDEPNASLDAAAEDETHSTLWRHRAGRTTLLVSHRLGALRDADRLVVLTDGEIEQEGTHADLLASGGGYADLFRLQAAGYVRD